MQYTVQLLFAWIEAQLWVNHGNTRRGKNGIHAFGYNSVKSEPIWIKSGALRAHCWGPALADFGCDLRCRGSLRNSWKFFGQVHNAWFHWFPVGKILRHLNTTTLISEAVTTFRTEFWKFYHKGSFFSKNAKKKSAKKFPGLATSGHHNSAIITDRQKFTTKLTLYEMSSFHFYH